jgi:hypothetical protein
MKRTEQDERQQLSAAIGRARRLEKWSEALRFGWRKALLGGAGVALLFAAVSGVGFFVGLVPALHNPILGWLMAGAGTWAVGTAAVGLPLTLVLQVLRKRIVMPRLQKRRNEIALRRESLLAKQEPTPAAAPQFPFLAVAPSHETRPETKPVRSAFLTRLPDSLKPARPRGRSSSEVQKNTLK